MFKLFKTILKAGNEVTVKYPFAPMPVCPGFRGKPEYNAEQCIACGACTNACPANALSMHTDTHAGSRTWQIFYGRCIFCGRCEEVCPTKAIALSQDFELAVAKREDLFVRASFTLTACTDCGRPFAPRKEIDYTMALLEQSGLSAAELQARRAHYETCPECKRKQNVPQRHNISLGQHLDKGAQS